VSGTALLDVNLLVALFDPDHVHHDLAHDWFANHRAAGWATCPLTENGLVRVLSNPKYESPIASVSAIVERLGKFRLSGHHRFWTDTVSLTDDTLFKPALVRGHRQLTDVYLLGLAVRHGGRLVTFDRAISMGAVVGADRRHLEIVSEVEAD
jgi:toxin-antitoxin system PIN domain toxin